jgi:hypothetical protein
MRKLLLFFLMMMPILASSQERIYEFPRLRIGIEAGFENQFGSNIKPSAIRESQSFYRYEYSDYYYDCGFLYNEPAFARYYFGIKPEYSLSLNFAISAGLRIAYGKSSLTADKEYFLWKVNETESSANYLRIKEVNQSVFNIGVPLYLLLYPNKSDIWGRVYGKVGVVLNFTMASDISVNFVNNQMNKYSNDIKNQFDDPTFLYGQVVFSWGLKLGRMRNPYGSMEFQLPINFNNKTRLNSLYKLDSAVGVGVQTTLYIPSGKNKLSYTY